MINKNNLEEANYSKTFFIIITLITVFLGFILGWICYGMYNARLTDNDKATSKTVLTTFTVIGIISLIIILIVVGAVSCHPYQ